MPPEARGREPPSFFFFLDLLPRWEKGFPSGPWLPWRGRGESPSEIGSISLSLSGSAFCSGSVSPFRIYMEIHNSDCPETFAVIFFRILAFLQQKKSINRLTVGSLPRDHLGHWFALIFLPNFPYFPKISSVRFYPVWTPFDMDIL